MSASHSRSSLDADSNACASANANGSSTRTSLPGLGFEDKELCTRRSMDTYTRTYAHTQPRSNIRLSFSGANLDVERERERERETGSPHTPARIHAHASVNTPNIHTHTQPHTNAHTPTHLHSQQRTSASRSVHAGVVSPVDMGFGGYLRDASAFGTSGRLVANSAASGTKHSDSSFSRNSSTCKGKQGALHHHSSTSVSHNQYTTDGFNNQGSSSMGKNENLENRNGDFGEECRGTGSDSIAAGPGADAASSDVPRVVAKLRRTRKQCQDRRLLPSAVYWAEKALTASKGDWDDLYWLAHLYLETAQYSQVIHLLDAHSDCLRHPACRYLLAKAHAQCEAWDNVLSILEDPIECRREDARKQYTFSSWNSSSAIHLLRGEAYKAKDRVNPAIQCFKAAVRADPYCHEAFRILTSNYYLDQSEEQELFNHMLRQCDDEGRDTLRFLYGGMIRKSTVTELAPPTALDCLKNDVDVQLARARAYYDRLCYGKCYSITSNILQDNPHHSDCLSLHVDVLVSLSKKNDLFLLAHKLVSNAPKAAFSWYAVGCYYYLIEKQDQARHYFTKATNIDKLYGMAYLAFGHSFAVEGEHDQAMAAYCTAARLLKGSHLPYLYRGMEYLYTNHINVSLARDNLMKAQELRPDDPQTLHELGVCYFREMIFNEAVQCFKKALTAYAHQIGPVKDPEGRAAVEATLVCLGQTYRKQGLYDQACDSFDQAIELNADQHTTYAAKAFTRHLQGNVSEAIDLYHVALSLKAEDAFCEQMLTIAVKESVRGTEPDHRAENEDSLLVLDDSIQEKNQSSFISDLDNGDDLRVDDNSGFGFNNFRNLSESRDNGFGDGFGSGYEEGGVNEMSMSMDDSE